MSEDVKEAIDAAKARDVRFRYLELGLEVEAGLREGNALHALMATLKADGMNALHDFAYADLGDTANVMTLQARAYRFQFALDTLNGFLIRGQDAARAIQDQDAYSRED